MLVLLAGLIVGVSLPLKAQLSKGQGEIKKIAGGKYEIYLPHYFKEQTQPPGIIHEASGTFICIVEIPDNQQARVSGNDKDVKKMLVDERMSNVEFKNTKTLSFGRTSNDTYLMTYDLQGFKFERINRFIEHEGKKYLILANYHMTVKNQVFEEVIKAIDSIRFL